MRKPKAACVNQYNFKIKSSKMKIWIGVQNQDPKYEWWMRLSDLSKFQSEDNEWTEFAQGKVKSGDVVSLILNGESMKFMINGHDLGQAFLDRRLLSKKLYPCVFIEDANDAVTVLKGSITQMVKLHEKIAENEEVTALRTNLQQVEDARQKELMQAKAEVDDRD